jgi:hypothetical protein
MSVRLATAGVHGQPGIMISIQRTKPLKLSASNLGYSPYVLPVYRA